MDQILEHLRSEGFEPGQLHLDKLNRFPDGPEDKRNSGWARIYRNFTATEGEEYYFCLYGSWRVGEPKKYCTLAKRLPREQAALHKEQLKRAKEEAEKKRQDSYREIAEQEVQPFFDSLPKVGRHQYLDKKGLGQPDLRLGVGFEPSGSLYVPCRDSDGYLWSCEQISESGRKMSWSGARKQGTYHVIGPELCAAGTIYLAEGFATAASIHLATGCAAVCCFGSGQLEVIGKALKAKFPQSALVVCGDLDKEGKPGGAEKAEKAAKQLGCGLVFPQFKSRRGEDKDFNDLHQAEGLEAVKAQLVSKAIALAPLTPAEIAEVAFPDEDDKGRRLGTYDNVKELIRRLGIVIRYNGISKKEEVIIPGVTCTVDNEANVKLAHLNSWCAKCRIPKGDLTGFITALADENAYNPVAAWIESEKWDGKSRLQEFFDTLQSPNKPLKERLMKLWLVSAVAAAYEPEGVSAHGVLVLQGAQYMGKTKWFRSLCPEAFRIDGVLLKPDDKDSVTTLISHWLGELGELDATFKKSDISQLKAFIPKQKDIIRRPYARLDSSYPRRTVFVASVNDPVFLNDPTGNRRFWTIDCTSIDYNHTINMQQLWAEALELYHAGHPWLLTAEELKDLNEHNTKFEAIDPLEEMIHDYFPWDKPADQVVMHPVNSTEVLIKIGARVGKAEANQVSRILTKMGVHRDKRKKFWVPMAKDLSMPNVAAPTGAAVPPRWGAPLRD